ncbi:MAG: F0F1 ATP synthase subunit epsilon [Streptosporangiales bacterium]|nr:F0F1 ATP synthase subunit epsilon [Streptosporangiales bacterium]
MAAKLQVELVSPERRLWAGEAEMVIAKTPEGEVGVMARHAPVFGTLVDGSVVRLKGVEDGDLYAAVYGGFFSVAENRVSILAEAAELGGEIDIEEAKTALERALASNDEDEVAKIEAQRAKARLRAAGHEA